MRRKLEFPLFYLIWVIAVIELILSVHIDCLPQIAILGAVEVGITVVFVFVWRGEEDVVYILLKPLLAIMLAAIIISSFVTGVPVMGCVLGPEYLVLFHMERVYLYDHAYKSRSDSGSSRF